MIKDGNGGAEVREFDVAVPLDLLNSGRVEDEINKFSRTLTPKIPTPSICHQHDVLHPYNQISLSNHRGPGTPIGGGG